MSSDANGEWRRVLDALASLRGQFEVERAVRMRWHASGLLTPEEKFAEIDELRDELFGVVVHLYAVVTLHLSATLALAERVARLDPTAATRGEVEDLRARVADLETVEDLRERIKLLEDRRPS